MSKGEYPPGEKLILMNMAKSFLSIAMAGVLAAAAAPAMAQASASARSDAQIQADVMSKLKADPQLDSVTVGAAVQSGVVTLTGNVGNEAQLTEAENDISSIEGITKIVDNMQVNPTVPTASAPAGVQNEAAQTAANAAPPPDQGQQNGQGPPQDQGQAQGQDQGQFPQGPPPAQGTYQGQPPPPPQDGQNGNGSQGQYGNNGQYGGGQYGGGQYGNGQGQYRPRMVRYDPGNRQVTLPAGTVITVRTLQPLQAGQDKPGEFFKAVVGLDVMGDRGVAIPRGTAVTGQVVDSKKGGSYKGAAILTLQLSNLTLGNQAYNVASDVWNQTAAGKGGRTAGNAAGGAIFGALVGAIAGGGPGAAIGAAAGGVTGAAGTGLSGKPQAYVPQEGLVSFRLTQPLTFTTVTPEQARLLAAAAPPMPPQQPMRRPPPPPGYYYGPYGPYPY